MRKVAVVGCGGINSWAVKHLNEVCDIFDKNELIFIKLFDRDEVEEKNLLRSNQNFKVEDLMKQKAEVLGKRFKFDYNITLINENNLDLLDNFDDIILGVDNHKTRRLLYDYALKKGKYLLDMRAQGTQMSFYILDKEKTMEYYDKRFFSNKDVMERKGGCQLASDVVKDHIENGNKIISFFGIYGIYFKHLRGEKVSTTEWKFAY